MGQKILVVEDNELNLKLFCDLLRAHGYEAEPVRDGRDAIDRARAFAPDLVVMDIQMPHVSGLELIEQIKRDDELKVMPIMAVTAYAAKGDEERIRDAGAEGYVSKPISVMKFVEAVQGLLAARPNVVEAPANLAGEASPDLGSVEPSAPAIEAGDPANESESLDTVRSATGEQPDALKTDGAEPEAPTGDGVAPPIEGDEAEPRGETPQGPI